MALSHTIECCLDRDDLAESKTETSCQCRQIPLVHSIETLGIQVTIVRACGEITNTNKRCFIKSFKRGRVVLLQSIRNFLQMINNWQDQQFFFFCKVFRLLHIDLRMAPMTQRLVLSGPVWDSTRTQEREGLWKEGLLLSVWHCNKLRGEVCPL